MIKECWEGKSSVLGAMGLAKYLESQKGVEGRQEQFFAFTGDFVPWK